MTGWRVGLAILVVGTCWLAFTPVPPRELDVGWDKANHWLAFCTLACTACMAFPQARRRYGGVAAWLLALGIFIELVQSQLPNRSAELVDIVADCVGIGTGLLVMKAWLRLRAG